MSTTIKPSTLIVNISESIILNGINRGGSSTYEINSIAYIDNRIMTISNDLNGTGILSLATGTGSGVHDPDKVKYIRLTNLDDANDITIAIALYTFASAESIGLNLPAGKSIVIGDTNDAGDTQTSGDVDNLSLKDIVGLTGKADTAPSQLEVYVASIR